MHVERYDTPEPFLRTARAFLEAHEDENNNVLRVATRLLRVPQESAGHSFWCAVDGDVHATVACTPDGTTLVSRGTAGAFEALAAGMCGTGTVITDLFGPAESADAFAPAWAAFAGCAHEQTAAYELYALERVVAPQAASGSLRSATPDDCDAVLSWYRSFCADTVPQQKPHEDSMRRWVEESRTFFWCDPYPVCMASYSGHTDNAAVIGRVYTPSEFRGRGYAATLVAALSQQALDSGYRLSLLFASPLNPALRRLYTGIGYRVIAPFAAYAFRRDGDALP